MSPFKGSAVSLGNPIKTAEDFNYCDKNTIVVIDHNLNAGERIIKIAAKSIFVPMDVTITAKEIEFDTTEGIFCLGSIACSLFTTYAPKSYIAEQGNPNGVFRGNSHKAKDS